MNKAKKTVVIIDDEVDLTELFSSLLEDSYDVIAFNRPNEFIAYLTAHKDVPFDALISDFNMPQMTGLDMIKKCFEQGYHFPFILFSAYLEKEVIFKALQIGAFRLLEKPSTKDKLEKAIEEIIVEHDSFKLRGEIRSTIDQLREYYSFLKIIITDRIPQEEMDSFFLQTDGMGNMKASSPEEILNKLEEKMDLLFSMEEDLESKKGKFFKSA
ncbi:MAG: response regulator [Bdellovibrionaceae bacterium]|nr:response regulator [Pseudobdellovibrionaceae bacterium]